MSKERATIILPTYNSLTEKRRSVELCLMSLSKQDFRGHEWEIIIVDNGSTDGTCNFVEKVKSWFPIRMTLLNAPVPGARAFARNCGVKESTGDKVIFVDDDMLFPNPRTLTRLLEAIEERGFSCGIQRLWTYIGWDYERVKSQLIQNRYNYLLDISTLPKGFNRESGYRNLLDVSFIANCGGLTRALFEEVGGFNEEYVGWGRDDCDLMYRLLVECNASFINAYDLGPIVHLNHDVNGQGTDLSHNEAIYQTLEKRHKLCLRYSHLFGQWEHDDYDIFVYREN
ncbi:MAG: glycosyltransferase [Deltaproteobacteria bacterium]|nr:glycosyltransferase [Deltaproteobacteria bacterium]